MEMKKRVNAQVFKLDATLRALRVLRGSNWFSMIP